MLTLNMIVKDEEATLPVCLRGVRAFVDEIIIVDTGSKDATIEVAGQFDAEVHRLPWPNDFAQARNYALSKVKTPWTLWLDADDLVLNPEGLKNLVATAHKARVSGLWCRYLQDAACEQRRLSLFKTRKFRWEGVVHESPVGKSALGEETALCDVQIQHRKPRARCVPDALKYLELLLNKDPDNWLGLAESYKLLATLSHLQPDCQGLGGETPESFGLKAYDAYFKALNHPHINVGTQYLCWFHLARLSLERALMEPNPLPALEAALKWAAVAVEKAPHRAECRVVLGQAMQLAGHTKEACLQFQEALALPVPQDETGCVFPGYYQAIPQALLAQLSAGVQTCLDVLQK